MIIVMAVTFKSDGNGVFCLTASRSFQSTHELQEEKELF